jgi:polysaccharide biosynthesis transport protein
VLKGSESISDEVRRACLDLEMRHPGVRSIMLTGPMGGEGTTTITCLYGRELSELKGESVVIVDANLRAPGVHRNFSINVDNGLRDWEPGSTESTVHPRAECSLSVMPAGSDNGRSLKTLQQSGRLDQLVAQLKRDFSFVLWDTPPLNLYSDGKVLLPYVDGVLVVVEGDGTRLDALAKLYEELADGAAPVLGVIINRSGRYYGSRPAGGRALRRLPP